MPEKLKWVTVSLHVSAALYAIIGLLCGGLFLLAPLSEDAAELTVFRLTGAFTLAMCVGLVIFIEWVVSALKQGKYWAWIVAICLAALYLPSLFLPLGVVMLIGLLNEDTTVYCRRKNARSEL